MEAAIARLRETKFVGMEYFGSREETPLHASLDEVDASDLYLGIVAGRYGSGITEAEYRRALERGLPCLFYKKQSPVWSEDDLAQTNRLEAFLAELGRHTLSLFTTPDDLAAQVTADLHRWLFDKVLVPWFEKALRDERARQQAEEILSAVRSPEDLGPELIARLRQAGFTLSAAPRSTVVGGAIMRSIFVAGDHNQVFVGAFETLADSYIEPWPVFERLHLDRFTGREWLTAKVDSFLNGHDRGCFILEADAGLGKSAFLAHLVQERGWIHHFVERAPGQDGVGPGLRSLAAQIALAWRLEPYTSRRLLPAAASRPDFLQSILFEAARRRDELSPGEKIVLAVDALDESAAPPDQNVLGLPRVLPPGVYLVVSQRPVEVAMVTDPPPRVVRLESGDLENIADMREFLERTVDLEAVSDLLAESGIAPSDFVTTLLNRSGGVWIYLRYVLAEIERGERCPLELEKLPQGLWQYYAEYWRRRRAGAGWDELELPLLATLAAIQEELSAHLLCAFAGIAESPQVARLLGEVWRPFLAVSDVGERRYRCYHASLREFLDGNADRTGLTIAQQALADELAAATRAAHGHIADRALAGWGGFNGSLERLRDSSLRHQDSGYNLRHLVTHLNKAGRLADLSRLLRLSWEKDGRRENVWYTVHEEERDLAGYIGDLIQTFRAAHEASEKAITRGEPALSILLELDCAYWIGSVRSLAGQVPPALLAALVAHGIWSKEHALAYANQIPNTKQRFLAMAHLIPLLPEPARGEALGEAIAASHWLSVWDLKKAYASLPLDLPQELMSELLQQELAKDTWQQALTIHILAPKLPEELLDKALLSFKAQPTEYGEESLRTLLPLVVPPERAAILRAVVEATQHRFEPYRTKTLLSIAPFLPRADRERITQSALLRARSDKDLENRALVLAHTVPALQGKEQEAVAREALEAAFGIDEYQSRSILQLLIPLLPGPVFDIAEKRLLKSSKFKWGLENYLPLLATHWTGRPEKFSVALSRVERLWSQGAALASLAPGLPDSLIERALTLALKIHSLNERAVALGALASRLSRQQLERALASIHGAYNLDNLEATGPTRSALVIRLASLGQIERSLSEIPALGWRAGQTLADILRSLRPEDMPQARAVALKLSEPASRAAALTGIASMTFGDERSQLLLEALRLVPRIRLFIDRRVDILLAIAQAQVGVARENTLRKALREIRSQADRWIASKFSEMLLSLLTSLPDPLLREALTLVNKLDETDAQPIFRAFIPRLPEALAIEALLLGSHQYRWLHQERLKSPFSLRAEKERFFHVSGTARLCALFWTLVPEFSTSWVSTLVRGLAACLPGKTTRARLLTANAFDSRGFKTDVLSDAVTAARLIPCPMARAAALTHLTRGRDSSTAYWALAAALAIPDPASRADALEKLAPLLSFYLEARLWRTACLLRQSSSSEPTITEALEILRDSASTGMIRRMLDDVPESEQGHLLQVVLESAGEINEPVLRAWALLELVPYLPTGEGEELVHKGFLELRGTAAGPFIVSEWARRQTPFTEPVARALLEAPLQNLSSLLVAAASHLPPVVLPDALKKAWALNSPEERTHVLRALAPNLASLPAGDLHPLWADALGRAAGRGQHDVLTLLEAFLPLLERLGGPKALEVLIGWDLGK